MSTYAKPVQLLIDELGRLPGVGPKSAQRIAFHLLKLDLVDSKRLADAIVNMKRSVTFCSRCYNIAEEISDKIDKSEEPEEDEVVLCYICSDSTRDSKVLCVVEEQKDVSAIEKTHTFKGIYHVLGGVINPLDGIGPDQLKIKELAYRVASESIEEVVLCNNPNLEGETTAAFIANKILSPFEVRVTRLASGLPVGGDLEYADELTLGKALEGRQAF